MTESSSNSRPGLFRFGLQNVFLLIVLISVALGWPIHEARKQRIAVKELEKLGCAILYYDSVGRLTTDERIRELLAEDEARNVDRVFAENSQLNDAGLANIRELPHLQALYLKGTKVTNDGLAYLQSLTRLTVLDLEGTQVTDGGLIYLQGLVQLYELDLTGTQITDAGMVHLHGFTDLRDLYLCGTQVTDAGVQTLTKALPKCHITH